ANPRLAPLSTTARPGRSRRSRATESSLEPLSTTIGSSERGGAPAAAAPTSAPTPAPAPTSAPGAPAAAGAASPAVPPASAAEQRSSEARVASVSAAPFQFTSTTATRPPAGRRRAPVAGSGPSGLHCPGGSGRIGLQAPAELG